MNIIGCLVLDQNKNLGTGISTRGIKNKKYGRLGDALIIGFIQIMSHVLYFVKEKEKCL